MKCRRVRMTPDRPTPMQTQKRMGPRGRIKTAAVGCARDAIFAIQARDFGSYDLTVATGSSEAPSRADGRPDAGDLRTAAPLWWKSGPEAVPWLSPAPYRAPSDGSKRVAVAPPIRREMTRKLLKSSHHRSHIRHRRRGSNAATHTSSAESRPTGTMDIGSHPRRGRGHCPCRHSGGPFPERSQPPDGECPGASVPVSASGNPDERQ